MLLTEYNKAEAMELFRKEDIDQNRVESTKTLMRKLKYTALHAMDNRFKASFKADLSTENRNSVETLPTDPHRIGGSFVLTL